MQLTIAITIFVAGFLAGVVNAVAGGGTFITFGALTVIGVSPILANTTSSLTQFPGYIASALAYRAEIQQQWRAALALCVASIVGATLGSWLLLALDNASFRALVPWLLLAATLLFAAGPWLKPRPREGQAAPGPAVGLVVQGATAVYGGFFGAGVGVMMLATLGLTRPGDYH
ncbi:MAG TPA: sulfite exporter TauE/SafE family protein, partial [Nannocystis sp.]